MDYSPALLRETSLTAIQRQFRALAPPDPGLLVGFYRGAFVGPCWLLALWPPLLVLTGLGGWWGKEFSTGGNAVNIIQRRGRFERRFPMEIVAQASYLDGRPGLALHYHPENPFPWPLIVDELRRLDAGTLLGMTAVDRGGLRRLAFPFTLQQQEAPHGL